MNFAFSTGLPLTGNWQVAILSVSFGVRAAVLVERPGLGLRRTVCTGIGHSAVDESGQRREDRRPGQRFAGCLHRFPPGHS